MLSHCRSELKFNENAAPWAATQGAGLARERRTASNLLIRSSERRLCRRVTPVDPLQQAGQLGIGQRDHALSRRGPDETTLLEPFGIKRHADAVVLGWTAPSGISMCQGDVVARLT